MCSAEVVAGREEDQGARYFGQGPRTYDSILFSNAIPQM